MHLHRLDLRKRNPRWHWCGRRRVCCGVHGLVCDVRRPPRIVDQVRHLSLKPFPSLNNHLGQLPLLLEGFLAETSFRKCCTCCDELPASPPEPGQPTRPSAQNASIANSSKVDIPTQANPLERVWMLARSRHVPRSRCLPHRSPERQDRER